MAMSTTYLVCLLALGFIMLMIGWPWWLGVGVILVSLALAVTGEEQPLPAMKPVAAAKPTAAAAAKKEPEGGFDVWDMKWSPTTLADGFVGNKMGGPSGSAVGSRSGAFSQDMGPIRFKDDIRFRLNPEGAGADFYNMCKGPAPGLTAWDFRTRKDAFPGLHIGSVKTVTSPDDMTNPGLGSPNEWIAAEKKKRDKQ